MLVATHSVSSMVRASHTILTQSPTCAHRLVLELCDGTLTGLLSCASQELQQRGLPVMDVLVLGIALTDATLAVHEFAHSLHLDIKPDNVLLRPSRKSSSSPSLQVPVLTDFGLMHNCLLYTSPSPRD